VGKYITLSVPNSNAIIFATRDADFIEDFLNNTLWKLARIQDGIYIFKSKDCTRHDFFEPALQQRLKKKLLRL
jgi:hypothetical protein